MALRWYGSTSIRIGVWALQNMPLVIGAEVENFYFDQHVPEWLTIRQA